MDPPVVVVLVADLVGQLDEDPGAGQLWAPPAAAEPAFDPAVAGVDPAVDFAVVAVLASHLVGVVLPLGLVAVAQLWVLEVALPLAPVVGAVQDVVGLLAADPAVALAVAEVDLVSGLAVAVAALV